MLNKLIFASIISLLSVFSYGNSPISIDLTLDEIDYVVGERVRAVVNIKNMSPDTLSAGYDDSKDRFFIEIYRANDMVELERVRQKPFIAPFVIKMNEGQLFETFLGDHFSLLEPRRYLARPVLVHKRLRYEGQYRAFDIVPGLSVVNALQIFSNRENLQRKFELVRWSRKGIEHLFLTARDEGEKYRSWHTTDIGAMMKLTPPTISILPTGEVIVIHRTGPDHYIRSEFWSMPNALEFHSRELLQDPETAGQNKVQEMYNQAGGVKPVDRPWWKFW